MLDLYSWATPNGHKVHIMLEECGLPHQLIPVDIHNGQQHMLPFVDLGPNRKIPVLVDSSGLQGAPITLFESGAILIYLAEKTGRFLANEGVARYQTLQWLMFQMSAVGPNMGQSNHFRNSSPEVLPYAIDRFVMEVKRLHSVMDAHLSTNDYFGGAQYSIADMAIFPWLRASEKHGVVWENHVHLQSWFSEVSKRPAVQRALLAFTKETVGGV